MTLQQSKHYLKVRMGYEITTSTGHTWAAVPEGWRDESTKLTWKYEDEEGKYTYDDAVAKFGTSLPTKEEWEVAECHCVREVLDLEGKDYWSASVYSTYRSFAWFFNSFGGNVNSFTRSGPSSVRLISR